MPELPEVETIRRGLRKLVINKKIEEIIIKKPKLVKNSESTFRNELIGSSFLNIGRIGKLLIFSIKHKSRKEIVNFLLIHLKMTGQLVYCDKNNFTVDGHANSRAEEKKLFDEKKDSFCQNGGKYTHIVFTFQDGSRVFFNDLRQFGYLKVVKKEELEKIKDGYGIEPGRANFNFKNFKKALGGRKANIKALLLNQTIISGLGNIYVDESLFLAKINPKRLVISLSEKEQKLLFKSIQNIIRQAVKYKGTTFSNFVDSRGRQGNYKQKLKVYGKEGKKCRRCRKNEIKKIKVAGRGTHFCPKCQII